MAQHGKILAVDYGKKSIGLAVSDESRQMVFGRGALSRQKDLDQILQKIHALCQEEKIVAIVIGLPFSIDQKETPQTQRFRAFAEKLKRHLENVPIFFQDESFTSFEADQFLSTLPASKKYTQKELQDELAAVLILKRYLHI